MSYELASKITHDKSEQSLVINHCTNNVEPRTYSSVYTITADKVENAPASCDTDYSKIMYQLFTHLITKNIQMNSTVSAKFRTALKFAELDNYENGRDIYSLESFSAFLEALDNAKAMTTKDDFIVITKHYGKDAYYKGSNSATLTRSRARVFKTLEDAKYVAFKNQYHQARVEAF